jgi:polysaccharide biosynthesis transport protein
MIVCDHCSQQASREEFDASNYESIGVVSKQVGKGMMSLGTTDFSNILRLVWHNKLMIILAAMVAGTAAFAIRKSLPPRYQSEGLILIEYGEPSIPELNAGSRPPVPDLKTKQTEADALASRAVMEAVVRHLDLARVPDPGSWLDRVSQLARLLLTPSTEGEAEKDLTAAAVQRLQKRLWVANNDNSRIVTVRFTDNSPELAARVVNAVMDLYIAGEIAAKRDVAIQASSWLTERVAALRAEVEAADRRVREFSEESDVYKLQNGLMALIQLGNDEAQLADARQSVARLQSAIDTARQMGTQRSGAAQETLASPVIQQLRDREAEAVQHLAKLSESLGKQHPERLAAQAELRDVRGQIDFEVERVVASLSRDLKLARDRVAMLEKVVATRGVDARNANSAEVTLAQLKREADAKRQVYETFLARADQTQFAKAQFPPARVISPAAAPLNAVGPSGSLVATLGGLAGGLFATAVCLLRSLYSGAVRSARELGEVTGVPNAGSLAVLSRRARRRLHTAVLGPEDTDLIETLRAMRMMIRANGSARLSTSVLVTSAQVGDGKTTLAASFARLCAADGVPVLLVEADLRRPRLSSMLETRPTCSLEMLLAGGAGFEEALQTDPRSGLHCLLAAGTAGNPHALLASPRLQDVVATARQTYKILVFDSPPMLYVADPILLAPVSDVVLFAVKWNSTPRALVVEALSRFPAELRAHIMTVLTRISASQAGFEGYYRGYRRPAVNHSRRLLPAAD